MVIAMVLTALFMAGCVSNAPVKETSNSSVPNAGVPSVPNAEMKTTDRYVELEMIDGSAVGGKYISESAAFVTIIPMYAINNDGVMGIGNGEPTGIKTALINTMKDIENPSAKINATLEAQRIKAAELAAAEQKAQEEEAKQIAEEKKRYEAEIAKRMPTKKSNN
jgi:hypothetical protein